MYLGLACVAVLIFDFCFMMMRGKRVSVVSLLSPRPVRFSLSPSHTRFWCCWQKRDESLVIVAGVWVFLASYTVIAPFRVSFVSERDGIRLLA